VADCLWAVFVIATAVDVDVPSALASGMSNLSEWLAKQEPYCDANKLRPPAR
jgi:hypothetical protein